MNENITIKTVHLQYHDQDHACDHANVHVNTPKNRPATTITHTTKARNGHAHGGHGNSQSSGAATAMVETVRTTATVATTEDTGPSHVRGTQSRPKPRPKPRPRARPRPWPRRRPPPSATAMGRAAAGLLYHLLLTCSSATHHLCWISPSLGEPTIFRRHNIQRALLKVELRCRFSNLKCFHSFSDLKCFSRKITAT